MFAGFSVLYKVLKNKLSKTKIKEKQPNLCGTKGYSRLKLQNIFTNHYRSV